MPVKSDIFISCSKGMYKIMSPKYTPHSQNSSGRSFACALQIYFRFLCLLAAVVALAAWWERAIYRVRQKK